MSSNPIVQIAGGHACCGHNTFTYFYHNPNSPQYNDAGKTKTTQKEFIQGFIDSYDKEGLSRLFTAILIDSEMKLWWDTLKEMGFRLLIRFRNANGNWCNLVGLVCAPQDEKAIFLQSMGVTLPMDIREGYWKGQMDARPWMADVMTRFLEEKPEEDTPKEKSKKEK